MFKIVAAAITGFVMLCVPVGDLLAEVKKPGEGPGGIPDEMQAIQTSKPVLCERTMPLLNRFAEDKDEQLLVQYKEPQHNTGGMVWWNAENKTIHILEFPPMMKGEFACMLVFGIEARMGVPRKKGETPL